MSWKDSEQGKEYQRRWKAEHREQCRNYHREWKKRNPEKIKQYKENNKEKLKAYWKEYGRQWFKRNKEKKALYDMNRQVRLEGFAADLTGEQWEIIKNVFKQKCAYCGKRTRRLTKDHVIPLAKGGTLTLTNIVPACKSCNSKKGVKPPLSPLQTLFL